LILYWSLKEKKFHLNPSLIVDDPPYTSLIILISTIWFFYTVGSFKCIVSSSELSTLNIIYHFLSFSLFFFIVSSINKPRKRKLKQSQIFCTVLVLLYLFSIEQNNNQMIRIVYWTKLLWLTDASLMDLNEIIFL
jgi:hypothetical protein